jgi:hypothetical protein
VAAPSFELASAFARRRWSLLYIGDDFEGDVGSTRCDVGVPPGTGIGVASRGETRGYGMKKVLLLGAGVVAPVVVGLLIRPVPDEFSRESRAAANREAFRAND